MAGHGEDSVYPLSTGSGYGPITGITLRQYFAGLVVQGLAANANTGALHGANLIATRAVEIADALIAALHPEK